jgi:hypothetical protein
MSLCRRQSFHRTGNDDDAKGEWYAFERGATKTTGGEGWADVWKQDHFGWEYIPDKNVVMIARDDETAFGIGTGWLS